MTSKVFKLAYRSPGFSLIEMAVVMMILGILMSSVLVAVSQTTENTRRTNARTQLREIEEALYAFAQTHGRLPCPASATSEGIEWPSAEGCAASLHGFVPSATIGLYGPTNSDGLLVDPWQNPIRYSVSGMAISFASIESLYDSPTTNLIPANMLCISDQPSCTGTTQSDLAPAVILSMGANWANFSSAAEQENASASASQTGTSGTVYPVTGDSNFVSTTYAEDTFDDQLVWLSPYVLFSRMISAGQLP